MPPIHRGDSTHYQDQPITPANLSAKRAGKAIANRYWARFQTRPATDRGCLIRMLNTTPA